MSISDGRLDAAVQITVAAIESGAIKWHSADSKENTEKVTALFTAVAKATGWIDEEED